MDSRPNESAPALPPLAPPPPPPPEGEETNDPLSSILFGVPDRSATASAPPDLEISSRSLFAFRAGYTGIFSDIRLDDYYESFYNENPERLNLPPPLPNPHSAEESSILLLQAEQARLRQQAEGESQRTLGDLLDDEQAQLTLSNRGKAPSARRPPHPTTALQQPQPQPLSQRASSRSVDVLAAPPEPSPSPSPAVSSALSQEQQRTPADLGATASHERLSNLGIGEARTMGRLRQRPSDSIRHEVQHSVSAAMAPVSHHQHAQQRYGQPQRQQPLSGAESLWPALNQLSLDDMDGGDPHSPRRLYAGAASSYAAQSAAMRTPYDYLYPQPSSPLEPPPQLAGPLFDSPPQQHWGSQRSGVDLYDMPRYDAGVPQEYSSLYKGRDDSSSLNMGLAPGMEPPIYNPTRGMYNHQQQSIHHHPRRGGGGAARNNGRSRGHLNHAGGNSAFGYMYGSRGAGGLVVPPSTPDYLNAQAAAAAAAAAAAVYKNGGVHINGSGSFSVGGPSSGRLPMMSMRGGSGEGKGRRGGNSSHDCYGRGGLGMKMNDHHRDSYSRGGGRNSDYRDDVDGSSGGGGGRGNSGVGSSKLSSFNDIIGRAEELARDQHGCRFLQTKLEEGNQMYINSIFEECYEKFVELMTDPFGNYLCQKLFEHCNDSQRLALVERCAPAFPRVSTNMHGTRAVQRMVECLSTPEQVEAVCKALAPAAVALMKDINGNHVIQRCLHRMDPNHNQFVYDAVADNCFELATHRHGCCVMQRCMDFASPTQRNQLAKQINANALPLVQNAFGNYVVQYVLGLNDPNYTAEIIRRLRGHVAELSMQKFSSNVVEKGLLQGGPELRREMICELIEDLETMRRLLHDAYGNYVIQRALQVAESPQLEQICEAIRPHLNSLRQSPYGKRIQAKIQKRMPKCLPASIASS